MNATRFIEAATLTSIGALCAVAIITLAVPKHVAASNAVAQATHVETVTIVAKRLTAAEKSEMQKTGGATI